MLERDKEKLGEGRNESTGVRGILTGGWFSVLQGRFAGTGEDIMPQGRRPVLLVALLAALCAWFLSDGAEQEAQMLVAPPTTAVSQTTLHEEAMGAKEAQDGKPIADPFSLLHSDEQATLAAMVAVGGGDERSDAAPSSGTGKGGSDLRTGDRRDAKNTDLSSGAAASKAAGSAAVLQVRGTVTSNVGTVLLLSVGDHDFFLAEGEEKEGVLLQSLSDKKAVVVIGGKSYTLTLPG